MSRLKLARHIGMLSALLASLALAACGSAQTPIFIPGPSPISLAIAFKPAITYDAALQTVTDLGLQPGFYCGTGTTWQPAGQRATFATRHTLVIVRYDTPVDWTARLAAAPGVVSVTHAHLNYPNQTTPASSLTATFSPSASASSPTIAPYVYTCPGASPPAAGTPIIPNADPAGVYARVGFTSPLTSYADALAVIVNLGLRLANPCREAAAAHDTPPPWRSPGQEGAFASTRALVVATTWEFTSNQWQRQLAQVPGVSGVESPYAPACA